MNRFLVSMIIVFLFLNISHAQEKYTISLPDNYDKAKAYPLFIVFHGGNSSMKSISKWWKSKRLSNEFIVAYFEASTLDNKPNYYGWRNLVKERDNIKQYYKAILCAHKIDANQVYVGGFSLGGKVSVDLALNQIIPVKGLISLNHGGGTTSFFTDNNVNKAKALDVRFVLISGEKDMRYKKETEKIKNILDKHKVFHKLINVKNLGHSVPDDFSTTLDDYIEFIVQ